MRVRAIPPEGDEIQVGRIEHQLDADQHQDRIAPREGARKSNGKEQSRENDVVGERRHGFVSTGEGSKRRMLARTFGSGRKGGSVFGFSLFTGSSRMAMTTPPNRAAVSKRPMACSGST